MTKISVCMATYNGEKYIVEQLNSILSQLGPRDEVIISDDGSTDNTLEVAKSLNDKRIKLFYNELENGFAKNFENAILKSTGDIVFLADQDDVWLPRKVELFTKKLENAELVVGDVKIVDGNLNVTEESHFQLYNVKTGFLINFLKTRYIGASMAFKREILQRALPFPKNQKKCAHDYWLTLVAEKYYRVKLVEQPTMLYRRHGNNASTGGVKSNNTLKHKLEVRGYCYAELKQRK